MSAACTLPQILACPTPRATPPNFVSTSLIILPSISIYPQKNPCNVPTTLSTFRRHDGDLCPTVDECLDRDIVTLDIDVQHCHGPKTLWIILKRHFQILSYSFLSVPGQSNGSKCGWQPNHFLHDELRFGGIGVRISLGSPDHALHKLSKPLRMVFSGIYKQA